MACFYLAIYVLLVICQPGMGTPVSTPQGFFAGLDHAVYAYAILGVIALIIVIIGGWALWNHIRKSKLPDEEQPTIMPKASIKEIKQDRKRRKKRERKREEEKVKDVKEQKMKDKISVEVQIETKEQGTQTDGPEKRTWKLLEFWINRDLEIQRRREEELREEEEFFS
ncbi:uncharacterized protein LOC128653452 [Bombina bombina]|uniref:uncharacterized protein LOC128653452 n=1 Tax=Bombina bombina TaxID=8345 RepID=UPI00235AA48D|nr:uncharacterized protein LOC128653452 [Bombina bombina]